MAIFMMQPDYPIWIIDISEWQNYHQDNTPGVIDFAKVAQHPKVKGIMVKCSEGTWSGYNEKVAIAQLEGANAAGLRVMGYAFQKIGVSPSGQAAKLKSVTDKLSFKVKRDMVDAEDQEHPDARPPQKEVPPEEYHIWIPKARMVAGSIKATLNAVAQMRGEAPVWYSGNWYQDWWMQFCYMDGVDMSWTKLYPYHNASYTAPWMYQPYGIPLEQTCVWQWSSTPPEDKQVEGFPWKARLDMNYWLKSEQEFIDLFGGSIPSQPPTGGNMSGTWVQTVPPAQRGNMLIFSQSEKTVYMNEVAKYGHLVTLGMGGSDGVIGSDKELYADSAFKIRAQQCEGLGVPFGGLFSLSAAWHLWKEHEADKILKAPYTENQILEVILSQWRKVPLDYKTINAGDGKWFDLKYLILYQGVENRHSGDLIPEPWFAHTLEYAIKFLVIFMEGGFIPKIPIFVLGSAGFFSRYTQDYGSKLYNLLKDHSILGVGISDPTTDLVPMANPFPNMGEALKIKPPEAYVYPNIPYGFESAVYFHVYTWNRFLSPEVVNGEKLIPYMVANCCDTQQEMYKMLGVDVVVPPSLPPTPPPVENPEVLARLETLEATVAAVLQWANRNFKDPIK